MRTRPPPEAEPEKPVLAPRSVARARLSVVFGASAGVESAGSRSTLKLIEISQ
jgi:hypothetical protein